MTKNATSEAELANRITRLVIKAVRRPPISLAEGDEIDAQAAQPPDRLSA
jgi:hypothetical protein